ncbi:MAG: peptidase MA family metallohydrolase [Planctomycetota bacterium]
MSRALLGAALALALGWATAWPTLAQTPAAVESAEDLAELADLADSFRRGGSWSALRDLTSYLEDFPQSDTARRLAARVDFGRGRLAEAEAHVRLAAAPDAVLLGRILLRSGRAEEALALAEQGALQELAAAWLRVSALDALGRRQEALRAARLATDSADDTQLDGYGLLDLARLHIFQRRFELANQALVFADAELNGKRGPAYRLVEPEVLLLLGEVYTETRQAGEGGDRTLALLNDVLKLDPGQPQALVTKARAYVYGMNGRLAEEALDRALTRDPELPEALLLRGRTRLLDRRPEAAREAAERVLAVNPGQREALALAAVALELGGGGEAARIARQRFESAHPESAALEALLGEVLQSHYRFDDSVAPLRRALEREPHDERPLPVLAQSLAHLGQETEARVVLLEHERRSPFPYPWRSNLLAVLEALRQHVEVRGEAPSPFRLLLPPGEQDVLGPLLLARLETARVDLAQRWGVDPQEDVLVEVFDRHADFSVRTVGFAGFGALGACFGRLFTMLSPQCELRGDFAWAQTAVHEYAHVVTLALSRHRIPRWLTEGVSVWEEQRADSTWVRPLERPVLDARANGLLLPVTRLDESFRDGRTVILGYYQSALLCQIIERDFGFGALRGLVAAYGDGLGTAAAIRSALGVEPEELDRRLLQFVDGELSARAVLRPRYEPEGRELLRRRVAEGDVDAQLLLSAAYHDLGQKADEETALQRYLQARGETPAALRRLAERDLAAGQSARARERLQTWARTGRPDADGLQLLASLHLQAGDRAGGLAALREARALFPGDVASGSATEQLLGLLDPARDADERRQLLQALCERDSSALAARVELAREARRRGHAEEAVRLLRQTVLIDPYLPALRLELGELLSAAGDVAGARAEWRAVLAIRSQHLPEAATDEAALLDELLTAPTPESLKARDDEAKLSLEECQARARELLAR